MCDDPLEKLEQKVEQAITQLELLKKENGALRGELRQLQNTRDDMTRSENDRSQAVRSKLMSVLSRIEELEAVAS